MIIFLAIGRFLWHLPVPGWMWTLAIVSDIVDSMIRTERMEIVAKRVSR